MFYDGPKTTWQDAQSRCKSMNANLIKIENTDEKVCMRVGTCRAVLAAL